MVLCAGWGPNQPARSRPSATRTRRRRTAPAKRGDATKQSNDDDALRAHTCDIHAPSTNRATQGSGNRNAWRTSAPNYMARKRTVGNRKAWRASAPKYMARKRTAAAESHRPASGGGAGGMVAVVVMAAVVVMVVAEGATRQTKTTTTTTTTMTPATTRPKACTRLRTRRAHTCNTHAPSTRRTAPAKRGDATKQSSDDDDALRAHTCDIDAP